MATFNYKDYITSSNAELYQTKLNEDVMSGKLILMGTNGKGHITKSYHGPKAVTLDKNGWKKQTKGKTPEQTIALFRKNGILDVNGNTHSFTHIFKTPYSNQGSKDIKPKTSEQETISLLIIENLLSSGQPDYKSFTEMMNDKKSGIRKAFPKIDEASSSWKKHWDAQFNQVSGINYLKNSDYDVYKYDGFMQFITKLVTKDNDWYSKKDSWNPADIWLIKNSKLATYKKLLSKTISIEHVNRILRHAARKGFILGISLKKSDGENIHFDIVNIELDRKPLPEVVLTYTKLTSDWGPRKKKPYYIVDSDKKALPVFLSKTSTIRFEEGGAVYDLYFRSNQSTLKNITWEIKNIKGSAFLGKVPVDKMTEWLKDVNEDLPLATNQDKSFSKSNWNKILNKINSRKKALGLEEDFNTTEILKNIETSYEHGLGMHNGNYLQMLKFVYCLALMKDDQLTEFLTKCYYFSQKKGTASGFGPFGKLY